MGEGKKPSEEIRYLSECGYYKLCQVDMDKILAEVESLEAEAAQNIQDLGTLRTQIEALQESNAQLREELKQAQYYSGEFEKLASDTQGRLDSAQKLVEKWKKEHSELGSAYGDYRYGLYMRLEICADELEAALGGCAGEQEEEK